MSNNGTPGRIDEEGRLLHPSQGVRINQVVGDLIKRGVNRDDVGPGQERVQVDVVQGVSQLRTVNGIVGNDRGTQGLEDPGHGRTDLAGADDSNGQVMDLAGLQTGPAVIVMGLASAGLPQVTYQTHDMGQDQLGNRPGRIGRHVGHHQSVFGGCFQVDDVVPGDSQ